MNVLFYIFGKYILEYILKVFEFQWSQKFFLTNCSSNNQEFIELVVILMNILGWFQNQPWFYMSTLIQN